MWWWVIGAAVVLVIVVRRVRGEPLNARDLWVAPVILTALGVWTVAEQRLGAADLGWLVAASLLGLGLGFLRGWVVVVYEKNGALWQRYTWHAFAVAGFSALIAAGFDVVVHPAARPVTLTIGISFLGESLAVTLRALRLGIPFAPERSRR